MFLQNILLYVYVNVRGTGAFRILFWTRCTFQNPQNTSVSHFWGFPNTLSHIIPPAMLNKRTHLSKATPRILKHHSHITINYNKSHMSCWQVCSIKVFESLISSTYSEHNIALHFWFWFFYTMWPKSASVHHPVPLFRIPISPKLLVLHLKICVNKVFALNPILTLQYGKEKKKLLRPGTWLHWNKISFPSKKKILNFY